MACGLFEFSLVGEEGAQIIVGRSEVRADAQGTLKVKDSLLGLPVPRVFPAPREVSGHNLLAQAGGAARKSSAVGGAFEIAQPFGRIGGLEILGDKVVEI